MYTDFRCEQVTYFPEPWQELLVIQLLSNTMQSSSQFLNDWKQYRFSKKDKSLRQFMYYNVIRLAVYVLKTIR